MTPACYSLTGAGLLPSRVNTLQARTLARFIEGNTFTGLESVFSDNTTRLAAVVHQLKKSYGWQFVKVEKPITTKDSRSVSVTEYSLSQDARMAAFGAGAGEWIARVHQSYEIRCKGKAIA